MLLGVFGKVGDSIYKFASSNLAACPSYLLSFKMLLIAAQKGSCSTLLVEDVLELEST